jgi:aromatic ring hydroxylase
MMSEQANLYHPEIRPQLPLYVVGKDHKVYESFRLFKLARECACDAIGSC